MSQALVGKVEAESGNVAAVGTNNGTINVGTARKVPRRFIDVPRLPKHPLIGRDDLVAVLRARLCGGGHSAISAVNGLPGVGKTALAIAIANDEETVDHFRGGVLWAGLGPNGDANSALNRWGTALGVDLGAALDASARARLLSIALQEKTEGEPVLLVVDDAWNWEHARPFTEIAFPGCAHLFTTRDAVLAGKLADKPIPLGTLTDSDAETFLAERCPGAREADPEGLHELVQSIGGLPLGLTLIAEELRREAGQVQWIQKVIARLRDTEMRLTLETPDARPGLEGVPNTLRSIVELSVLALVPEEQRAFVALGAFAPKPADFERDAAAAVWEVQGNESDTMLHLLTSRGLLEIAGEGRFALHQVLASVALCRLGNEHAPRERHALYYRSVMEADNEAWRRIERELEQLRTAWTWICVASDMEQHILSYASSIRVFHERQGLQQERLLWLTRGLGAARALGKTKDEAALLNDIGNVHSALGDKARALQVYELVLAARTADGDQSGQAATLSNMGQVHRAQGNHAHSLELYERALPLRRGVGDRAGEATTLNNMGIVYSDLGDKTRALELYELALVLRRATSDRSGEATTLNNIGNIHSALGNKSRALELYEQSLPLRREVGDRAGEATTLNNIGNIHSTLGNKARALELYESSLSLRRAVGDRAGEATSLNNIGRIHSFLGHKSRALEFYELSLQLRRAVGDRSGEKITLFNISKLHAAAGRTDEAISLMESVVGLDEAIQHPDLESDRAALENLRAKQKNSPTKPTPAAPRFPRLILVGIGLVIVLVISCVILLAASDRLRKSFATLPAGTKIR